MPSLEPEANKAQETGRLVQRLASVGASTSEVLSVLDRIHELYPFCRPYWEGHLKLYVNTGRRMDLPMVLRHASAYTEEILGDGRAKVIKNCLGPNQGHTLPRSTEPTFKRWRGTRRTAWQRLLEDDSLGR